MKKQLTTRQRNILRQIVKGSRSNSWATDVRANGRKASAAEIWTIIRKIGEDRFETQVESGTYDICIAPFGSSRMGYKQRQWSALNVRPVKR